MIFLRSAKVKVRSLKKFVLHNFCFFGYNQGMIKPNVTIESIKQAIKECYLKPVTVKLNLGRNKYVTFPATLSGIYPSIFTVEPNDKNFLGKTAYSYSEILCGRVKITAHKAS